MSNGQTSYYWSGLDLLAQSDGSATKYLTYDGLGSVRQVTDSAGSVQYAQTFDPYGNLYSSSSTNPTKYAFTGEQQDTNGLLFLRARYYNPTSGRFFQLDRSRKENNLFAYVQGNPVNAIDLTGNECWGTSIGDVCQGLASQVPVYYYDFTQSKPVGEIQFKPANVDFHPLWYDPSKAGGPTSDENIQAYEDYRNLCGPVAVGAILQNLLGASGPTIADLLKATIRSEDNPNGLVSDCSVNTGCITGQTDKNGAPIKTYGTTIGDLTKIAAYFHINATPDSTYKDADEDTYFKTGIGSKLNGQWPIVLIEIELTGQTTPKYQITSNSAIRHWIVITGISLTWDDDGEDWKWVRIFNPVINGTEYYRADRLFSSIKTAQGFVSDILWVGGAQ